MSQPPDNPYAAPQTPLFQIRVERKSFHRSGGLLIVTLFQVSVVAVCFVLATLASLAFVLSDEWRQGPVVLEDVMGLVVLGSVLLFAFILYAEFRGFRPSRRRERITLFAIVSASVMPLAAGGLRLYWFRRLANQGDLNDCIFWFTVALVWIISAGLRAWLAFRKPGVKSQSVFSD